MNVTKLFREFFTSEKSSGFILIFATALSLALVNIFIGEDYLHFWHRETLQGLSDWKLNLSIEHWINDGLMTIFFLLVGLEIERELYMGELSDVKNALLPIFAAVGGMIFPALIHFVLNSSSDTQKGFGIPMATDIAFALGILSLVGKRVPFVLKVFLTALAIIDDLGAIIIIAVFYTKELQLWYLCGALVVFGILLVLNRLRVYKLALYFMGGIVMWYCFLRSGVHATIAGVLLAFAIPFGDGGEKSPSYKLQHWLHKPVAFFILPLFALANTGILFEGSFKDAVFNENSIGIIAGLVIGKPLGILLTLLVAVRLNLLKLPENIKWKHLAGAGMLAGIGFTMSIFITLLAFDDAVLVADSKIAVLLASLVSGVVGFLFLKWAVRKVGVVPENQNPDL
jgi:NhaA family Na+:H+ antiporter